MKNRKLVFILGVMIGLWAYVTPANAMVNRYIDSETKCAQNCDGSSWVTAMKNIPSTLTRDTTYWFADGTYGFYSIKTSISGTSEIIFKKATVGDHGTDNGWDSSKGDGQAYFSGIEILTSYVKIDGNGDSNGNYGFKTSVQWSGTGARPIGIKKPYHVTADNITIRWYEYTNNSYDTYKCGVGVYLFNGNNYKIQNCHIHDSMTPIMLINVNNVFIENNYIQRNVSTPAEHANGIDVHGASKNITIRYNIFEDIEGTAVLTIIGGPVSQSNWQVYGNIFYWTPNILKRGNGPAHGVFTTNREDTAIDGLYFFNNTIANLPGNIGTCSMKVWVRNPNICKNTFVKNNVWYCDLPGECEDALNSGLTESAYNWYSSKISSSSEPNKEIGNYNPFIDFSNNNFRLGTPISRGVNLEVPFNVDMDGTNRGGDGGWSRGAFQYKSSNPTTVVQPPGNLRIF